MNTQQRKEQQVRRLLDGPRPALPPDLGDRAADVGRRLLHRRRAALTVLWTLLALAAFAFTVWAATTRPWETPPETMTPPPYGW